MIEENGNNISKFNKYFRLALSVLTIIGIIAGAIWTFNCTYASKDDLRAESERSAEARNLIAEQSVKTFKLFREQMVKEQKANDLKRQLERYQELLNNSYKESILITNQLAKDPNNQYLKQRLENEQNNQNIYRNKINNLLSQ